jgi:hypothetical protein
MGPVDPLERPAVAASGGGHIIRLRRARRDDGEQRFESGIGHAQGEQSGLR